MNYGDYKGSKFAQNGIKSYTASKVDLARFDSSKSGLVPRIKDLALRVDEIALPEIRKYERTDKIIC